MLSRSVLVHTTLISLGTCQDRVYQDLVAGGPYGAASGGAFVADEQTQERFARANQSPNITKSFEFPLFYVGGVNNAGRVAPDESNVWTLRKSGRSNVLQTCSELTIIVQA